MPPKKAAKKHAPPPGKDLRRAWEHLGRTEKLLPLMSEENRPSLIELVQVARTLVKTGPAREAADLLRAAEHLAFAHIETATDDAGLAPELMESIAEEYADLCARADEHWHRDGRAKVIAHTYEYMRKEGRTRMKGKRYREALEFARGAEALTHVRGELRPALTSAAGKKTLAK